MRIRPAGDSALLVELDDLAAVHALRAGVLDAGLSGVEDVVAGARTLLLVIDPLTADRRAITAALPDLLADAAGSAVEGPLVEVPVRYTGPDLDEVAGLTGFRPAEVVRRHSAPIYTVAFLGFSPGFGYLVGLDPALHVPRRDTPRPSVPAGSVAIAGDSAAIYPQPTPGGWRLLGSTELRVFDPAADPPALLAPGHRVRFVPIT